MMARGTGRPVTVASRVTTGSEVQLVKLTYSSTLSKEATAFGFGIHQFANKVGSLVLGWNHQTRSDYLFVVSRLMKIQLMMTRKMGHGPGRCARQRYRQTI